MSNVLNKKTISLEPRLPLNLVNGDYERVDFQWENIPVIQLNTDPDWWGNAITDNNVGGKYYKYSDEPIQANNNFLARKSALAVQSVQYLKDVGIASKITASATNPEADRVEVELKIIEKENLESETVITVTDYRKGTPDIFFEEWQDTIDSTEEYQDTIASGDTIQDVINNG